MSVPAAAGLPSQMWLGVEQVKISCTFGTSVQPASVRHALCQGIAQQASQLTDLPVALATPEDLRRAPENLRQQDKQLLLRVDVDFPGNEAQPPAATMTVQAERLGLRRLKGPRTQPTALSLKWTGESVALAGPAKALSFFFAELTGSRLPLPPRSDRH